jgi:hypothetical protein
MNTVFLFKERGIKCEEDLTSGFAPIIKVAVVPRPVVVTPRQRKKTLNSKKNSYSNNEDNVKVNVNFQNLLKDVNILKDVFQPFKKINSYNTERLKMIFFRARTLSLKFYLFARNDNLWWQKPLINVNEEEGEIVLEWWNKQKKLTIYVCSDTIDFIKVWGSDIDNEMEDGSISLNNNIDFLWRWLICA